MLHSSDHNDALPEPIGALHGPSQLVPVAFEHLMIGMVTQVSTRLVHCTDARKPRPPTVDVDRILPSCACPSTPLTTRNSQDSSTCAPTPWNRRAHHRHVRHDHTGAHTVANPFRCTPHDAYYSWTSL